MSPMPRKRSTFLLVVGVGVFVIGSALAALATRGGDSSSNAVASGPTTTAPAGTVTTPAGLPSFVIPAGHQAIAVQLPFINGIAGYTKAGDHVNIYGAFRNGPANATLPNPAAKLVMSDIEVLWVSGPTPEPPNNTTTYMLSVDASQAEQLVYLQSFEGSYMTLARHDQGQLSTVGRSPKNAV